MLLDSAKILGFSESGFSDKYQSEWRFTFASFKIWYQLFSDIGSADVPISMFATLFSFY